MDIFALIRASIGLVGKGTHLRLPYANSSVFLERTWGGIDKPWASC